MNSLQQRCYPVLLNKLLHSPLTWSETKYMFKYMHPAVQQYTFTKYKGYHLCTNNKIINTPLICGSLSYLTKRGSFRYSADKHGCYRSKHTAKSDKPLLHSKADIKKETLTSNGHELNTGDMVKLFTLSCKLYHVLTAYIKQNISLSIFFTDLSFLINYMLLEL